MLPPLPFSIAGQRGEIVFGDARAKLLALPKENCLAIVESHLIEAEPWLGSLPQVALLSGGESIKDLSTIGSLAEPAASAQLDRHGCVIAIGGGALCDLVGFFASVYLRGVRCWLVPTTLLAQVDAAIGGKTALNIGARKNQLGTIRQPERVIVDPRWWQTLPPGTFEHGVAEIIKLAVLTSADRVHRLEEIASRTPHAASEWLSIVRESVQQKLEIVANDPFDAAGRIALNFGHTVAHAIERSSRIAHGEAVAIGVATEARFAVRQGILNRDSYQRIKLLLKSFGLPTQHQPTSATPKLFFNDKKRAGASITLPLPIAIGAWRSVRCDFQHTVSELSDLIGEE